MKLCMTVGLLASLLSGCVSIEISSANSLRGLDVKGANGRADRTVTITSGGYYLFDRVPLVCADTRWDESKNKPRGGIAWFNDLGGVTNPYELLLKIAESENCDLCNVMCDDASHAKFDLTSLRGLVSAIVNYTEVHTSAVLVPREGKKPSADVSGKTTKVN